MKIIGLDPASRVGYSVLEGDKNTVKLLEYGQITCQSNFTLPQKLNFIHTYLQTIFERVKPDVCAIEEPPLSISGVKVLILLARINGVVIQSAFNYLKDNVWLYEPPYWKAHSFEGLSGNAPKWKIQLEVCRHFGVKNDVDLTKFDKQIGEKQSGLYSVCIRKTQLKDEIDDLKRQINRKRNPLNGNEKEVISNKIKQLDNHLNAIKLTVKNSEKEIDKQLEILGRDVCAQTGLTSDMADATAIAYCLYKQLVTQEEEIWTKLQKP